MNFRPTLFCLLFFAMLAGNFQTIAQVRDTGVHERDTLVKRKESIKKPGPDTGSISPAAVTLKPVKRDSLIQTGSTQKPVERQQTSPVTEPLDTGHFITGFDSVPVSNIARTAGESAVQVHTNKITDLLLAENKFINTKDKGTYFLEEMRTFNGKEFTFYLLCILVFILAIFKTIYPMYFNNLFRIFFNTSLRQTQLTDQLTQAKLPSFILNIFFSLSAGIYLWLIFNQFQRMQSLNSHTLLLTCVLSIAAIYLFKFIILKFTGWLAGLQHTVDNYIFVIFLVNKIMGILLIPFSILLAFSIKYWAPAIAVISALFIGLLFLSRYAKSYGALEKKLSINSFHLLIFVLGAEIIPLLIFYKIAVDYLV